MLKKYITKIERKAMKCYLKLRFDLTNNKELVNTQYNWKVYKYYKKKYKKFIRSKIVIMNFLILCGGVGCKEKIMHQIYVKLI